MLVTNKSVYAIRFMLNLALVHGAKSLSVAAIAQSEGISVKFLENIANVLKVKGLVKVKRGAYGGYFLAKSPGTISFKQIIDAVEADKLESVKTDGNSTNASAQVVAMVFTELDLHIARFLDGKTLADAIHLLDTFRTEQMFYI